MDQRARAGVTELELPLPLADYHPRPLASMGRDASGRWTVRRRVADCTLPKPLRLSPNRVAWKETDIQSWVDSLPYADTDST